jgi:hypothetical protein
MSKYFCKTKEASFLNKLVVFFLFLSAISLSQTKTNLEVLYSLNDSLVHRIVAEIPNNNIPVVLTLNLGDSYSIFSNHIRNEFIRRAYKLVEPAENELDCVRINIVMEKAGINYGEQERDGWFGDYFTARTIFIRGNYFFSNSSRGLEEFHISVTDTVNVENRAQLQNDSFPFTKGEIPAEPFLSSLLEPVIAIGAAAAAVLLFFSVRSK